MGERKTFLCIGLLPFLACSLLLLVITFGIESRDIEAKVKASAEEALQDPKFDWVKAETHNKGRQVLLTGSAPNKEAIAEATRLVAQAEGVLSVTHNGEILAKPELIDPTLNFKIDGESITLSGQVASQSEIDSIVNQVSRSLPNFSVNNKLSIGTNLQKLPDLLFLSGFNVQEQPSKFSADISGDTLALKGYVPSNEALNKILTQLGERFSGKLKSDLYVDRSFCNTVVSEVQARGKINFATGKAIIDESSHSLLNSIVIAVDRCPETVYEVSGHTDNTGNYNANVALSERRANAVAEYLISAGLPAEQFKIKGYGPDRPIADNETEAGRSQNRRIEFTAYK